MANHDAAGRNGGVTPPLSHTPLAAEPNPTLREWFVRNGPALILLVLVLLLLYRFFDGEGLWNLAKAALGLGLVIFIHELGHFAVAKWCDVHVETFSIGFGPALPGCKFQYGETTYMLALIPLGGYVKMVGEGSEGDEADEDPRSFKNKSVWQRMAIISAGVIMNVILAFICFIVVFRGPGKMEVSGVVGRVVAGSPAWQKDVPAGAWIHRIGSVEHEPVFFSELMPVVMLSGTGEPLPFVYSLPPEMKQNREVDLVARRDETDERPVIGVLTPDCLELPAARHYLGRKHPVYFFSAASRATPPFEFEDVIIGSTDPSHPDKEWTELRRDPRNQQKDQKDYFQFFQRLKLLAGKEMTVRVRRKSGEEVSIKVPPAYHNTFGLHMQMGQITAWRRNKGQDWLGKYGSPHLPGANRHGDIIEQVEVTEPNGKVTRFVFPCKNQVHDKGKKIDGKVIDPTRLRFELQQWAARKTSGNRTVTLKVRRQQDERNSDDNEPAVLKIEWQDRDGINDIDWKFAQEVPFAPSAPQAIPELGLAFQITTTVASFDTDWWAGQPPAVKQWDVIKQVRFWFINKEGNIEQGPWMPLESDQWAYAYWAFEHSDVLRKITARVNGSDEEITLKAKEDHSWPTTERGLALMADRRIKRADTVSGAIVLGLQDTYTKITQVYGTLRGIITQRISPKNLGGPITIARVAFNIAGENFWEFVYFLGLISINLAVVNFLPIPVLDGGHMVFLIYEKIRGKPASEQVRSGATIVGLVLILSLMGFVIYLDISRLGK